jgi:cytochrome b involved in lipid metabolism
MIDTITTQTTMTSDAVTLDGKEALIACNVALRISDNDKEFHITHDTSTPSLISDSSSSSEDSFRLHYYTRSEIERHNTETSAWIVAGDDIYDVTDYIEHHPGGKYSIMKKIGGVKDCTQDLLFHSKSGQKYWKQFLVGKVTKNPSRNRLPVEKEWWKFWE